MIPLPLIISLVLAGFTALLIYVGIKLPTWLGVKTKEKDEHEETTDPDKKAKDTKKKESSHGDGHGHGGGLGWKGWVTIIIVLGFVIYLLQGSMNWRAAQTTTTIRENLLREAALKDPKLWEWEMFSEDVLRPGTASSVSDMVRIERLDSGGVTFSYPIGSQRVTFKWELGDERGTHTLVLDDGRVQRGWWKLAPGNGNGELSGEFENVDSRGNPTVHKFWFVKDCLVPDWRRRAGF